MVSGLRIAVTGATGFVGGRLLEVAKGRHLNCLTRRAQDPREGVTWVRGDLANTQALDELCAGSDAVIHIAGVINGDAAAFEEGNVMGTARLLEAAAKQGVERFVHVSSLAAREPDVSLYGASKRRSEQLVLDSGIDAVIVRPPAVYGPGDRETLELFKMAKRGLVVLPPPGRLSLIHADDLAELLLKLAEGGPSGTILEPDDGTHNGFSHKQFADALGRAVGRNPRSVSMSPGLVRMGAKLDGLFRGNKAKLTADRAAYFCHPDWVVRDERRPSPNFWQPRISAEKGLAQTAAWYREKAWL